MDLDLVAGELADALQTIPGLTVPEWGVQRIHPPAAIIALPERIDYDDTYGRGKDHIPDLAVLVLVANPAQPAARRAVAEYADGAGEKSVKAAVEDHEYTALESVRVAWSEFDNAKYAGTDYLAAIFHLDIIGKGA